MLDKQQRRSDSEASPVVGWTPSLFKSQGEMLRDLGMPSTPRYYDVFCFLAFREQETVVYSGPATSRASPISAMDRIQRLFQTQAAAGGGGAPESPVVDTAEMVYISSMALLKMLKHGCACAHCTAGVPARRRTRLPPGRRRARSEAAR